MPFCSLDDKYWDTLIYAINENRCILMLGPDASIEESNNVYTPCTEVLSGEMAEKISSQTNEWNIVLNPTNLTQVSQYYAMIEDRNALELKIRSFYRSRKNKTCPIHQSLAELPFYFAINSTPDQMYNNALKKIGKDPIMNYYHYKGPKNDDTIEMGTRHRPLIYYLLGHISEPRSLVLTEDNLLNFLVSLASDQRPLPANITSELRKEDRCFLFLGFGFKHWYLRILLFVLQVGNKESRSFALEEMHRVSKNYINEFHRTIIFFRESDYKIQFIDNDLISFVSELKDRFKQAEQTSPSLTPTTSSDDDAAIVFICHANEDKEKAKDLYDQLKKSGLRPWLDKENLRGGDQWDMVIGKTIQKEIDYFIVMQTKALSEKEYGYVNKEINIALNQHLCYRPGNKFIIPVKAEDCDLLEGLEHLQTIDIRDISFDELQKGLIKTIKRDFERRKKNKTNEKRKT